MSEDKPAGRLRSPITELAPVAVKVEDGAMNRPVVDGFTVDREKVWLSSRCALFGMCNSLCRLVPCSCEFSAAWEDITEWRNFQETQFLQMNSKYTHGTYQDSI